MLSLEDIRKIENDDIRAVMNTASGRNVIGRILKQAGVYDSSCVINDQLETFRLAAIRDFGLWLERKIKDVAFNDYLNLLKGVHDEYRK